MRMRVGMLVTCATLSCATIALAQRRGDDREPPPRSAEGGDLVTRMMEFDKDKDGKLTKAEVTDERLQRLFDRADANKDGTVTKEELTALAARERSTHRGGRRGGDGLRDGPRDGPRDGGPPGGGRGGFMGGPPRLGEILPPRAQQELRLTDEQKTQLRALQNEVDAKLERLLSAEQRTQLQDMREHGPGPPPGRPPGPPPGRGRPEGDDRPPPPRAEPR